MDHATLTHISRFRRALFCGLAAFGLAPGLATADDAMPKDTVAFFDGACPTGWGPATDKVYGRFLVSSQQGRPVDAVGGGDAITDITDASQLDHDHTAKTAITIGATNFILIGSGPNKNLGKAGAVAVSGTTDAGGAMPGIAFNLCQKTARRTRGLDVPSGVITAASNSCPVLFSTLYDRAEGRYVLGWNGAGSVGRLFGGKPLSFRETRRHQHEVKGAFDLPEHAIAGGQGCCADNYAKSGRASFNFETRLVEELKPVDNAATRAPYMNVNFCRSN
ncbi:hypothetical protein [Dinoroseobacter sp. S124A]|uniref:hypothetical protein n=1 Tax=Dinoroseobacter sp. S124A TaxID=3415128 RepID=UPI003C79E1D2